MKIIASLLFLLITNSSTKVQQHCIFDGANILVIQLVTDSGKPIEKNGYILKLNKPEGQTNIDSTSLCNKNWNVNMQPFDSILFNTNNKIWNRYSADYKELPKFQLKGCYAIELSNNVLDCLVGDSKNKNELSITHYNKKDNHLHFKKISMKNVFPLCNAFGKWENIRPYKFVLKHH
jgi:hypothetical protein